MMANIKNITSKYKENKQIQHKETNTLDNKHRQMVKQFINIRNEKEEILNKIGNINIEINKVTDISEKALLLAISTFFIAFFFIYPSPLFIMTSQISLSLCH